MLKRLISLGLASAIALAMFSIPAFGYDIFDYDTYDYEEDYTPPPPTQGGGFSNTPQQGMGSTNPDGSWGDGYEEGDYADDYDTHEDDTGGYDDYYGTPSQLDTPGVSCDREIEVGEGLELTWNEVSDADYYAIQSWTQGLCFDKITGTSYTITFDTPGVYAISVYAMSYDSDRFTQSEPCSFNVTVTDTKTYTAPDTSGTVATVAQLHERAYSKASSYGGVKVYVNGKRLYMDVVPEIKNGRTMVPLRAIFEALGATVDWNADTSTVNAYRGDEWVSLTISSYTMYTSGGNKSIDQPAYISGGRTLVPVRAISESFNCDVQWYGDKQLVSIADNDEYYRAMAPAEDTSSDSTVETAEEGYGYVTCYTGGKSVKVFTQNNAPWSSMKVKNGVSVQKDCCGLLSLKNAVYHLYGGNERYNIPVETLVAFCDGNNYMVTGGISWGYFNAFAEAYDEYGFKVTETKDLEKVKQCLANGGKVLVSTKNTTTNTGHIMTIDDYNSSTGEFLFLDSYPTSSRFGKVYAWQTLTERAKDTKEYTLRPASNIYTRQFWCITKR